MNTEVIDEVVVGRVEPHIYAFTTNTVPNYLKVGDTYRPVEVRLDEWREHFPSLTQEFEDSACVSSDVFFRDYSVHAYFDDTLHLPRLKQTDLPPGVYFSNEFFKGAQKTDVAGAIDDIRLDFATSGQRYQYYRAEDKLPTTEKFASAGWWTLRPNQAATVRRFEAALAKGRKNLLMYAVMRFGKSFTSMCCAQKMNDGRGAKLVVIVSAKADVKDEWRRTVESAENFRNDYEFFSSDDLVRNHKVVTDHLHKKHKKAVVFLTLQDLQSSAIKRKHRYLLKEKVDLLIVDETHYGARAGSYGEILRQTKDRPSRRDREDGNAESETREAVKAFKTKVTLHLSGTPYRILMGSEFTPEDIIAFCSFTDIAQEQKNWDECNRQKPEAEQKEDWDNPYYGFPQMVRFAFNPNASTRKRLEALRKGGATYAFSALFETESIAKDERGTYRKFKYEQDVLDLFQVIDGSKKDEELLSFLDYPKLKEGMMCRHIVCVLPYCASCDALAALIKKKKSVFKNLCSYEILNISGHDMPREYDDVEDVKRTIREFEKADKRTLTLTVNRMLTGSTVPEWDTMLYFKDTASPQEYDQAIFRLQNQYVQRMTSVGKDGKESVVIFNKKPQTLLVDFDPNRLFQMQESKAKFYNVNEDKGGNAKLEERIRKEVAFSPIIVMNAGKMCRVESSDVMAAVSEYSRTLGVSDEARKVGVDLAALDCSDELKQAILRENPLDDKNGFTLPAHEGDEEELDVPPGLENVLKNAKKNHDPSGENSTTTPAEEAERKKLEKKLRAYYSRLLFFAFLSRDKVQSVEDIVRVMGKGENVRIAKNVGIEKPVVKAILKYFDKFILSDLDYKIRNLDTLSFDESVDPLERATTALRKFDRLGPSEIMTPENIADDMVAMLPERDLKCMAASGEKILDIAGKAGEFAIALYKRYRAIDPNIDVTDMILTIPTSGHAYEFTRKVYEALGLNVDNIAANFTSYDLLTVKDKSDNIDYAKIKKLLTQRKPFSEITMKDKVVKTRKPRTIGAVIGNPPYHEKDGGAKASAAPMYQDFLNVGENSTSHYVDMVIPARWYAGGKGLDEFRDQMLADTKLVELHDFPNPDDCFSNVGINLRSGVCYLLWDLSAHHECRTKVATHIGSKTSVVTRSLHEPGFDIFLRYALSIPILKKVLFVCGDDVLSKCVSARKPFGLGTDFAKTEGFHSESATGRVPCYGKNMKVGYVALSDIGVHRDWIDAWKVVIPRANNIGTELPDDNLNTHVDKGSACTESYMVVGAELGLTKKMAENLAGYLRTRFVRFLHCMAKSSQDATVKTYRFVPMQDFNEPWTDEKLYKKYGITKEEQAFIESMIKPMA